jgi:hypothetical protein
MPSETTGYPVRLPPGSPDWCHDLVRRRDPLEKGTFVPELSFAGVHQLAEHATKLPLFSVECCQQVATHLGTVLPQPLGESALIARELGATVIVGAQPWVPWQSTSYPPEVTSSWLISQILRPGPTDAHQPTMRTSALSKRRSSRMLGASSDRSRTLVPSSRSRSSTCFAISGT